MQTVDSGAKFEVRLVEGESRAQGCFRVFKELRPHLDEAEFMRRWQAQRREGYRLGYVEESGVVLAAVGYRFLTTMAWGRILYVDDLITDPAQRARGLASTLLHWIQRQAEAEGCDAVHLDTGYQRHAAHRVYSRNGFRFECHHMAKGVERP